MTMGFFVQGCILGLSLAAAQVESLTVDHVHDDLRDPHAPFAYVERRAVDLGEVREGQVVSATFTIENRGGSDLIIKDVRSTCGCTTVQLSESEKIIAPNASRDIVARFDTAQRIGRQRKPVIVTLNDPQEPQITFTLVADVVSLFKVMPTSIINLRSVRRGDALEPIDVVPTTAGAAFEELKVDLPGNLLDVREEPIVGTNGTSGVRLHFSVPEDIELGMVNGTVTLTGTIAGETAVMPLRVTGQVVGDLVARPAALQQLTPVPRGHRFQPLVIASTNERPFSVLAVDAGPFITAEFEPIRQNKDWNIRLTLKEDAPDGPLACEVKVRTDHTGQPVLRIPLFSNVRPRLQVEPEMVVLTAGGGTRKVLLRAGENVALDIFNVTCDHAMVAALAMPPASKGPRNVRFVHVKLRGGAEPEESFATELLVKTSLPGAEQLRIPVEFRMDQRAVSPTQ